MWIGFLCFFSLDTRISTLMLTRVLSCVCEIPAGNANINLHMLYFQMLFLYHFSILNFIQADATHYPFSLSLTHTPALPRTTQLFIPQPIISSSCLFNLRVAPCISEQVVYLLSFPQPSMNPSHIRMNIFIICQSSLKLHGWGALRLTHPCICLLNRSIKKRGGGRSR